MAGGAPPIEPAIHCAARSFAVVSVAVALVIVAAGIRLQHLADIDLYNDEALTAEIASSLWQHGELNPFRFSRFLPDWYFRSGIFIYFPPLSYVVAAPFTALVGVAGPNIAPRLPALISGLVLIALLIPAGRAVFADTGVGVAAAALTVCNGFQIGMSRTALPYSLVPPLLLLTLLALLRANRRDGVADLDRGYARPRRERLHQSGRAALLGADRAQRSDGVAASTVAPRHLRCRRCGRI